jgi:glycosyltransferase involved in cell wall biosynthesis
MIRLVNTRVLMTADTVGGVWTYATKLSSSLTASGADIHLISMGPRPRPDQREMLSGSAVRLIESDLALEWQDPNAADLVHARDFFASVEERIRPDIIHLNSFREATLDWHAPVVVVAHSCVNSWGNLAVLAAAGQDLDWPVFVAGTAGSSAGHLARGIELLGELSYAELRQRVQRAAIFVSPARYEPFGLSVLEAATGGCALVLSDIPTFRELWSGAAEFVPPDDVDRLRAVLGELCADSPKRERLQFAAIERARRYSVTRMTDAYARLYRSLIPPLSLRKEHFPEAHP